MVRLDLQDDKVPIPHDDQVREPWNAPTRVMRVVHEVAKHLSVGDDRTLDVGFLMPTRVIAVAFRRCVGKIGSEDPYRAL